MNRAIIRRLLNEYLDGEIGLADKAELERLMAADPALRKEYQEMRRVSLLLGAQPEIIVHPYRLRQKLLTRLNTPQQFVFTPQRAFSGAMLVALLVVTLTFALVMYQEKLLGNWQPATAVYAGKPSTANFYDIKINVPVTAEVFFDRLLLETQLGMLDQSALAPFIAQTTIYEGAICVSGNGLRGVQFSQSLPSTLRVNVTARQAQLLHTVATELGGENTRVSYIEQTGGETPFSFNQFYKQHSNGEQVRLYLEFEHDSR